MHGLEKIKEINGFNIWKITSADALQTLSKGTDLCTQIKQFAEAYTLDTPIFMVTVKNNKGRHVRVCLIHNETKQCHSMKNVEIDEYVSHVLVSAGVAEFLTEIGAFDKAEYPFFNENYDFKKWSSRYKIALSKTGLKPAKDEDEMGRQIDRQIEKAQRKHAIGKD